MREDQCLASSVGPRVKPGDCARMLRIRACFVSLSFAGLVVLARSLNPIPSRTRPLNSSAPMVLWLKPWESRSLPGLPRTKQFLLACHKFNIAHRNRKRRFLFRETAFFLCLMQLPGPRFLAIIGNQHGFENVLMRSGRGGGCRSRFERKTKIIGGSFLN